MILRRGLRLRLRFRLRLVKIDEEVTMKIEEWVVKKIENYEEVVLR